MRWRVVSRRGAARDATVFEAKSKSDATLVAILCLRRGWTLVSLSKRVKAKKKTGASGSVSAAKARPWKWVRVSLDDGRKR